MKYIFIGAHVDDCELSCGGTMAKLAEEGHKVQILSVSICGQQLLADECYQSSTILGAHVWALNFTTRGIKNDSQCLADYFYAFKNNYDVFFSHSISDRHPDHRTVAEESKRVFNGNLVTYLSPWNGEENANYFVEITKGQLDKKVQALACYHSQSHRQYMTEDFLRSQARYYGVKCGKEYAEAFRIERLIQ
jgi:LmbE family N-acetylglucosaminyl deacetylase